MWIAKSQSRPSVPCIPGSLFINDHIVTVKGVRHNLKTHPRAVKTSALTIFDIRSSKMKLLNRYNLWLISYKFYQNDGFLTLHV